MNLLEKVLGKKDVTKLDKDLQFKYKNLQDQIQNKDIEISPIFEKLGKNIYYRNVLPLITEDRDVLKRPETICKIFINFDKQSFDNPKVNEIIEKIPEYWGWLVTTVDKEHTRNNFKNKEVFWVVFDSKERCEYNFKYFNMMFRTAIEQDAIDEYRKFKKNPDKRILTFDQIINNAYDLYDLVDKELA